MSHPDMKTVVLEVPVNDPEKMDALQDVMNEWREKQVKYEKEEAKKLGLSEDDPVIVDICYLRTRSRWTQEKEDCLVALAKAGKPLPLMQEDFDPKEWMDPNFDRNAWLVRMGYDPEITKHG